MTDNESFAALFGESERKNKASPSKKVPEVGDKASGRIVSIGQEHAFVDLGGKAEALMEVSALTDEEGLLKVAPGDTIEGVITAVDTSSGVITMGTRQPRTVHGSKQLEQAFHSRLPVEGQVSGVIKGGVEVQVAGIRAFCPISQLDIRYIEEPEIFVGQRLAFRITKFEGGRHPNLVLSRRALLEEEQQTLAEVTRASLEEGAVLNGTVTSIKDFGAFIDLGGIEGMVHISELTLGRVKHPSEILTLGQAVEVSVLRIEKTDNPRRPEKVALSIRALADDPWQDVEMQFPVGSLVSGTVTRTQPFGAFVELGPGIEGLVHVSELSVERRINHPQEVVKSGDPVEARVLSIDKEKKRIGLSLDTSRTPSGADASTTQDYGAAPKSFGTLGDLLQASLKKKD
ncbi:MAG: S1 RNA-binding domain-containing protein [Gammaproteobacteria bacterium]|nr:S1 RNA-binding domain-containing protein [Gammaproteobacteria bacterium]